MEKQTSKINIFDYTNYRIYLLDFYREQKTIRKSFSYRYFAKKAEINSIGLYKDVVEGRQSLGKALIFKFSAAIGHTKKESEYFENMVYFNEAKSADERTLYFERMMACHRLKSKIVDETKYEYYRKWYYSATRALIACHTYNDSPETCEVISKTLEPHIRPDQAQKAVKVLEKLGFVTKDHEGILRVADSTISSGVLKPEKNVAAMNIVNHQKEVMGLAASAFDRFGSDKLSMSTMTIGISEKVLIGIKEELAAIRCKIAALAEADTAADQVFQLNIQLFPVSSTSGEVHNE